MGACPTDGVRLYKVDDTDPLIGAVIDGRFRIDYAIGVGGMGTVYGGVQLSVNRDVAIKVLRAEVSQKEVALERFFREAKTISNLTHPNIVKLVDFGQDRDRQMLYLAMELVRGQPLSALLAKGRLRASLALDIVHQVCGALTEPHDAGVIHRDLKPDNLLLVPVSDGSVQVKVLDFGIARFMESNTQLTGTGMICGTPAYMAPEQAQNETLDARTDIYALGVVLYEMLSGWPPFSGTSSLQVMLKHIQEAPRHLRDLLPPASLPADLEQFVYLMMQKERKKRPESARKVRREIAKLQRKFELEPVEVDWRNEADPEAKFDKFILPKLPRPDKDKSGPTQVLRRETGLDQAAAPSFDLPTDLFQRELHTEPDGALGVTGPLTPDGKLEVAADALRVRNITREGAQQGWTPGGQDAVRSIKDTKDGVDVFGATLDGSALAAEDSGSYVDRPQTVPETPPIGTDELASANSPAPTNPSGRTVETSARSNLSLAAIAILCAVGAVGAALFVGKKIDDAVAAKAEKAQPEAAALAPATPELPTQTPPRDPALTSAVDAARLNLAIAVAKSEANRPAPVAARTKPVAKPAPDPPEPGPGKKDVPPTTPPKGEKTEAPKKNIDDKIKSMLDDDLD